MDNTTNNLKRRRIRKLLISNRSEISARIIQTCTRLSIQTVAIYSLADAHLPFVSLATESVLLHPTSSRSEDTYMNCERILEVVRERGCDALHPGYGFLSESSVFAKMVVEEGGVIWVGPSSGVIESIGDKAAAKRLLRDKVPSVPLIPGYESSSSPLNPTSSSTSTTNDGELGGEEIEKLIRAAEGMGFPLLIKASNGGGGKGMRVLSPSPSSPTNSPTSQSHSSTTTIPPSREEIRSNILQSHGEALRSFGAGSLLLERYFTNVKHIEIQICGDQYGTVKACFERECSVQRRHQKVIEEVPSALLPPELRERMCACAEDVGRVLGYVGVGTVEFILDMTTLNFFFLEVNTRLQVEHAITEAVVPGLDLVEVQLLVASGVPLSECSVFRNEGGLKMVGCAIECRLYAEDPNNGFFPCTGRVLHWAPAPPSSKSSNTTSKSPDSTSNSSEYVIEYPRYDTGIETGSDITVFYDPLISKITTYAPSRSEDIRKMELALYNTVCLGLVTNKEFLLRVLGTEEFLSGAYTTAMVDRMLSSVEGGKTGLGMALPKFSAKPISAGDVDFEKVQMVDRAPHRLSLSPPTSPSLLSSGKLEITVQMESTIISAVWWRTLRLFQRGSLDIWTKLASGWSAAGVMWRPSSLGVVLNNINGGECVECEYISLSPSFGIDSPDFAFRFLIPSPSSKGYKTLDISKKKNGGDGQDAKVVEVRKFTPWIKVTVNALLHQLPNGDPTAKVHCTISGLRRKYTLAAPSIQQDTPSVFIHSSHWPKQVHLTLIEKRKSLVAGGGGEDMMKAYTSSMPCRILLLLKKEGEDVKEDDPLLTMESMKMETRMYSRHGGVVRYNVSPGQVVEAGVVMLQIVPK